MSKNNYYEKNKDIILNKAKEIILRYFKKYYIKKYY